MAVWLPRPLQVKLNPLCGEQQEGPGGEKEEHAAKGHLVMGQQYNWPSGPQAVPVLPDNTTLTLFSIKKDMAC